MTPIIRPAEPHDQDAIEAIVAAAYRIYIPRMGRKPGPMLDDYAASIAAGRAHVLDREGTILGLVVLIRQDTSMLLDNIAVDPALKGHGFGRVLLRFVESEAAAAGYSSIELYTHETMTENIALYGRMGFVETRRVEEQGLRRVYMTKQLPPGVSATVDTGG